MGTVERVFVAGGGGQPMRPVDEVQAVAGRGLDGDRYATRRGYWTDVDECQVTLIAGEDLDAITESSGVAVQDGQHRRNIVTRDVPLNHLVGRRFKVGSVTLSGIRLCEPCSHLEKLIGDGVKRGLIHRGGLRAQILSEGTIRVGDPVEIDDPR